MLAFHSYCEFLYGPCLVEIEKNRIQKMQFFCCRLIYGIRKYEHISHKINKCKWLKMRDRCIHQVGIFVHKILLTQNSSDILKNKFSYFKYRSKPLKQLPITAALLARATLRNRTGNDASRSRFG